MALRLIPHLSNGWLEREPGSTFVTPYYLIKSWQVRASGRDPISGIRFSVDGLAQTITDVLVRVTIKGHRPFQTVLHPADPTLVFALDSNDGLRLPAYFVLGVEHILTGIDHLSFVLGLILLIGLRWELLKAITAFTLAHSITLALAALGVVHLPSAAIEALVAMSILFLGGGAGSRPARPNGHQPRPHHPLSLADRLFYSVCCTAWPSAGALAEVGRLARRCDPPGPVSVQRRRRSRTAWQFVAAAALDHPGIAAPAFGIRIPAGWQEACAPAFLPMSSDPFAAFWFITRVLTIFT